MFNQKGLAHILLIFILLAGIVAGVFLVGKQQIFRPKATGVNIEFLENSCTKDKDGTKVLICPKPKIKFVSPLEVGNAQTNGFDLIKTVLDLVASSAYAAGLGKGYYCSSADSGKIYHKEKICNPVLGIFCFTWLSSHEEEKAEKCDVDYECSDSTPDILNNVTSAKCVVTPKRQSAGSFQPRFISESTPQIPLSENPQVEPPVTQANRTPTPAPAQTSRAQTFQTQTSSTQTSSNNTGSAGNGGSGSTGGGNTGSSDNTGTGTTSPNAGTGATAPNTGTGATNPPPAAARTTIKFRFSDERDKLDSADWRRYTPGGTTIVEDFTFSATPGRKAIFAQFMDSNDQIIKFDSGQEFMVAYIVLAPETSPSPSPSPSPVITARPTVAPTPIPTPIPTASPKLPACNVQVDISTWPNCSNQVLINLPRNLLDMLPNEAIIPFSNGDLLNLFPKTRLATLPSSRTQSFSNGDLLAIADSTGDRRAYLSNFSCPRLASFSPEIKAWFEDACHFGN